jgi:hypothetical protein
MKSWIYGRETQYAELRGKEKNGRWKREGNEAKGREVT